MHKEIADNVNYFIENRLSDSEVFEYVKTLRENMKVIEEKFNKNFVTIFLLVVAFILFSKSAVTETSIGPFKVKDVSNIYIFIPVLIAYKYYETNTLLLMRRLTRIIHKEIVRRIDKPIFDSHSEYYLIPTSIFLTNEIILEGKKAEFIKFILFLFEVLLQLGFIVFEIYALITIYISFGITSKTFWIVVLSSICIMILGYYTLISKADNVRKYNIK